MRAVLFLLLFTASIFAEDPYLVVLTNARKLDTTSNTAFFRTLSKHPSDGSKNGDVGHAWIVLKWNEYTIIGGHSGDLGIHEPRYFEKVWHLIEKSDPNPVRVLWETRNDGFFEEGSGGHIPTFAARIPITPEQFNAICAYIADYGFNSYGITNKQCCTFAHGAARLAGLELNVIEEMALEPNLCLGKERLQLYSDPVYKVLPFASPDVMEKSLKQAVALGKAEEVTRWYKKNYPLSAKHKRTKFLENVRHLPFRLRRAWYFA